VCRSSLNGHDKHGHGAPGNREMLCSVGAPSNSSTGP
jgi:hypothetical protein